MNTGGKFTLAGVTSSGYWYGISGSPGVYTKVANYIDWIEDSKEKLNGNFNNNIKMDYQAVYSNCNNNHDYMNIRSDANVKEHVYTFISEGAFNLGNGFEVQWGLE